MFVMLLNCTACLPGLVFILCSAEELCLLKKNCLLSVTSVGLENAFSKLGGGIAKCFCPALLLPAIIFTYNEEQ